MKPPHVLLLPGWQNSGPGHWQTHWEARYGYQRVEQHDWVRPLRGDWSARLEEMVVDADGPVVLVAHSLGCILTAWWAAHSANTHRIAGALLVAPGDVEQPEVAGWIPGWAPVVRRQLPFPSVLVGSRNDPYCRLERAQGFAADWGARWIDAGDCGHINTASGLGDWDDGHALLHTFLKG